MTRPTNAELPTQYKQALDDFLNIDRPDYENFVQENVAHTQFIWRHRAAIRCALRIADAVESGRLVMESKFEYGDFALCEVNGHNACLEQLKRIGDGE